MGTMIERISLLEKKYSRVSALHADLNIMKMWLECQFGIVFPKGEKDASHEDEEDDNNPFFELEVMRQRVANLETKIHSLEGMQMHSQSSRHSHTHTNFSSAVALALKKPVTAINHRKYLPVKTPVVVRPKPKPVKKIPKPPRKTELKTAVPPPKLTPIINRQPNASRSTAQPTNRPPPTLTEIVKIMEDATAIAGERLMDQQNLNTNAFEDIKIKQEVIPEPSTSASENVDTEESPMELDGQIGQDEGFPMAAQDDAGLSPPKLENFSISLADIAQSIQMQEDNESSFEKFETTMPSFASQNSQQGSAPSASSLETTPEKATAVTYTTRGRRHVVPRRYAEFTAHTNVTAILKKQKVNPSPKRVVKLPEKLRPAEPVKFNSAAAAAANAGGPSCVRALVERIESLPIDDNGMIILSERFPHVITEQQKLLIIIQKSGGKATRLTRKITTLIFEDAVLASASPFGTKYYKDRLDPDRLEAIVDFILNSGFEQNFDEKKVYNIVAQVCNEARAGRVKKIAIKAEPSE